MENRNTTETLRQFITICEKVEKHYETYAKSVGLTYPGLAVLRIIYETPENCTQKFICEQTLYPKQSVNLIIRSFWKQGYIEMKEIDSDRRNKAIKLSESGLQFTAQVIERLERAEAAAMTSLTDDQRCIMLKLLWEMERGFLASLELDEQNTCIKNKGEDPLC